MSAISKDLRDFVKTKERYLYSASRSELLGLAETRRRSSCRATGTDVVAQHGNAEINFEPSDYHGMTHECPDSWERIADDMRAEIESLEHGSFASDDALDALRDYEARIRRLAEREACDADGAR